MCQLYIGPSRGSTSLMMFIFTVRWALAIVVGEDGVSGGESGLAVGRDWGLLRWLAGL